MSKHEHTECDHELEYCQKCDVVYCAKCDREWFSFRATWNTYPITGTTWYGYGTGDSIKYLGETITVCNHE